MGSRFKIYLRFSDLKRNSTIGLRILKILSRHLKFISMFAKKLQLFPKWMRDHQFCRKVHENGNQFK